MMKNFACILSLLLSLSLNIYANGGETKYPLSDIPEHLLENASAVLRMDETYLHVISPGKAKITYKWAYTILSEKADRFSSAYAFYDKLRKVESIKGTLYDAYGNEIRKLKKSDIEDRSAISDISVFEDNRVKIARLVHTSYPFTVEFELEETLDGLLFYPNWRPQSRSDVSVQSSDFEVDMPPGLELRFKEISLPQNGGEQGTAIGDSEISNEPSLQVKTRAEGSRKIYRWELQDHPAIAKPEPFSPGWRSLTPRVLLAPSEFEIEGYYGNMKTWTDFGKWQNKLNKNRDAIPEETKSKIRDLVADIPNKEDKIKKIYEYVQQKTRYVSIQLGIGGWQPFEASFVDSKGYGDCKALTNYTQTLLKTVGIESLYTIVKAGSSQPPILTDFPCSQFNHVFLCVPMEKDTIWLECTSQTQAFGYVGDFTGNRDVLLITPEGGKIARTPTYDKEVNQQIRNAQVNVSASGGAEAKVFSQYRALEEGRRHFVVEWSPEDQKKWLYKNVDISSFTIENFKLNRIKERIPTTEEELNLIIPKCASVSGSRMFLTANLMNRWTYVPKPIQSRRSKVKLKPNYDFVEMDTITYSLPDGYQIEYIPETVEVESQFGKYIATFKVEGNQFTYTRNFEMNAGEYPSDAYNKLIAFLKKVTKADKSKLVLVKK